MDYNRNTHTDELTETSKQISPAIEKMRTELSKRTDHLLITLASFISAFVLFAVIFAATESNSYFSDSAINTHAFNNSELGIALLFGAFIGFMISGIINGIILTARFLSVRSRTIKILAAVFFLITYICVAFIGIYSNIPYQIYNMVKIFNLKRSLSAAE